MKPAQLLAHFDRISDAPDAIPRLRQFILDLAVRGKLVEQDPRDEAARSLLKWIEMERTAGTTAEKEHASITEIEHTETPFQLPAGWVWLRFGSIHDLVRGVTYTKSDVAETQTPGHLPILRANNIGVSLNFEDLVFVRKECVGSDQMLRRGDYLIALSSGSKHLVGKAAFVAADYPGGFGGFCGVIRLVSGSLEAFVGVFLSSRLYRDAISAGSRGIGINNLKRETLNDIPFPLPPIAEQQRIVAKVDELMALCDRLEAAQTERESRRDRLVASSLNRLNNGADAEAFSDHARFYFNHLPRLTTKPEHIQQLRQTILNLAVRGKLVPQDPNDEPADNILIDISSREGGNTNGEGKLKTAFTRVSDEETSFRIPYGWTWTRIGCLCNMISGRGFKADEYSKSGARLFQIANVSFGKTKWETVNYLPINYNVTYPELVLNVGDLVMALNRPLLNRQMKAAIIGEKDLPAILYQRVGKFLFYSSSVLPEYLFRYLQSLLFIEQLEQNLQGSDQPFINKADMIKFLIPLPPLTEQQRIVAKVDKLMALCDKLDTQLTTTHTDSRRRLEAVLNEALASVI